MVGRDTRPRSLLTRERRVTSSTGRLPARIRGSAASIPGVERRENQTLTGGAWGRCCAAVAAVPPRTERHHRTIGEAMAIEE